MQSGAMIMEFTRMPYLEHIKRIRYFFSELVNIFNLIDIEPFMQGSEAPFLGFLTGTLLVWAISFYMMRINIIKSVLFWVSVAFLFIPLACSLIFLLIGGGAIVLGFLVTMMTIFTQDYLTGPFQFLHLYPICASFALSPLSVMGTIFIIIKSIKESHFNEDGNNSCENCRDGFMFDKT